MVERYLDQKRRERNDDRQGADAYANLGAIRLSKGDCKQYFFTGRCTKQSCPWEHENTLYPGGKGKSKGKGKSEGKKGGGKSKRASSKGADPKGKGKGGKNDGDRDKWIRAVDYGERGNPGRGLSPRRRSRSPSPYQIRQPSRGDSPNGKEDQPICTFYLQHKCKKGNDCPRWHSGPCRFYPRGECVMGKRCMFLHPKQGPAAEPKAAPAAKPKAKAVPAVAHEKQPLEQ